MLVGQSPKQQDRKTAERTKQGHLCVRRASLQAIAISLVIIIASAIAFAVPSELLETRMKYILEGLSFLFAAIVLGNFSFQIAFWLGLYYKFYREPKPIDARSLKELGFRVRWSQFRIFARYYFFLLPFFQGLYPAGIPLSMISGVVLGFFVEYAVYLGRRTEARLWMKRLSYLVLFITVFLSSLMLANAAFYISTVWAHKKSPVIDETAFYVLLGCLFFESLTALVKP